MLVIVKYLSNQGTLHDLRIESERASKAGAAPTTGTKSRIKAKISKSKREHGLKPRGVVLGRVVGTGATASKKYTFLPVLTPAVFDGEGFDTGDSITIDEVAWEIVSKVDEDY